MKKKIIMLLLISFLLVGCQSISLTKEDFIDQANYNGYLIENNKKGYENYAYIKNIYYAIQRENAYDIQFLELENDDYSKKFFDVNKENLDALKTSGSYSKKINRSDYNSYHVETDSKYLLVIRYKNNIIYIDAPIDYINEIEEFLQDLHLDY